MSMWDIKRGRAGWSWLAIQSSRLRKRLSAFQIYVLDAWCEVFMNISLSSMLPLSSQPNFGKTPTTLHNVLRNRMFLIRVVQRENLQYNLPKKSQTGNRSSINQSRYFEHIKQTINDQSTIVCKTLICPVTLCLSAQIGQRPPAYSSELP